MQIVRTPTFLLIALALAIASPLQSSAAQKPNIVLIVADDLGYADLGCQGSTQAKTPNIDSIATNGIRFTAGYVTCPVCSPTRAGLLTGRYQQRFGHELNPPPPPAIGTGLPLDQITLPQLLKANGYATGMFGKWHLGMEPPYRPWKRGFDEYVGFLHGQHDYFDWQDHKLKGRDSVIRYKPELDGAAVVEEEPFYFTELLAREAMSFIDRRKDEPFFLYLPFNAVHVPMQAPQKYLDRFGDVPEPKRKTLLAMLSAMDDAIGQVLGRIREHGLEDNTLIFFISDNGGYAANGSLNAPLRGHKSDLYEGGIRVPFLMQWKGRVPAGKVVDEPVISLDIFVTALAAAGIAPPKAPMLDGLPLAPLPGPRSKHQFLFWRHGESWAVRDERHKLIRVGRNAPQLFDLVEDASEQRDVSAELPDKVRALKAAYQNWNKTLIPPLWRRQGPTTAATTTPVDGD